MSLASTNSPSFADALLGLVPALAGLLLGGGLGLFWLAWRPSRARPRVTWAARFSRLSLAAVCVFIPAGGAACWQLPNGEHLHLGWTEATGALVVTTHHPRQALPQPTAFAAALPHAVEAALDSGVIPLLGRGLTIARPRTTVWYPLPAAPLPAARGGAPPGTPPPRGVGARPASVTVAFNL